MQYIEFAVSKYIRKMLEFEILCLKSRTLDSLTFGLQKKIINKSKYRNVAF